jgi:hypothetical protein
MQHATATAATTPSCHATAATSGNKQNFDGAQVC